MKEVYPPTEVIGGWLLVDKGPLTTLLGVYVALRGPSKLWLIIPFCTIISLDFIIYIYIYILTWHYIETSKHRFPRCPLPSKVMQISLHLRGLWMYGFPHETSRLAPSDLDKIIVKLPCYQIINAHRWNKMWNLLKNTSGPSQNSYLRKTWRATIIFHPVTARSPPPVQQLYNLHLGVDMMSIKVRIVPVLNPYKLKWHLWKILYKKKTSSRHTSNEWN